MKTSDYQPRLYRDWSHDSDLVSFNVTIKETDLRICATKELSQEALEVVKQQRTLLENYILLNPEFSTSLTPLAVNNHAPEIVKTMTEASIKTGVGPMAAVAGTIASFVGEALAAKSSEVIVENGGDIFLRLKKTRIVGIYAGTSPYSGKIALKIEPEDTPLGVCTSSGTVGHSLSFGKADAAIILAPSAALADAAATAACNLVKEHEDIAGAVEFVRRIAGISGVAIIMGDKMGVWGKINLVQSKTQ